MDCNVVRAHYAPNLVVISKLKLINRCSICSQTRCQDYLGEYQGRLICDSCANDLHPILYNADAPEILIRADQACQNSHYMSLAGVIVNHCVFLVEDDLGDVVYTGPHFAPVLSALPKPGHPTTEYLPAEIRLSYRRTHRESAKSQTRREVFHTLPSGQWTSSVTPFIVEDEAFTLTVIRRAA